MAETNGSSGKPVTSEDLKAAVSELKTELRQGMERVETALLTAFHGYAQGVSSRFKKLEVSAQSVDERMAALESRVLELETRRRAS